MPTAQNCIAANLQSSLCNLQAAEKKLQELEATSKQSQNAQSQVSKLEKELAEAKTALQASQDAGKAADGDKVICSLFAPQHAKVVLTCNTAEYGRIAMRTCGAY